jgi:elongation factor P
MDSESFEQIAISESSVEDVLRWMTPSSEVDVLLVDDEPSDVQLPSAVDLEVSQTDPGVRGDTVSGGGTKPATLETGAVIQVPLFVESGQRIRVDTRSGEYVARA